MKIMTILGTRPEIIRLSIIIKKLDKTCNHILVHTGQNYAECLNDIFFRDLAVRKPDYLLGIREKTVGAQIGRIITKTEKILTEEKPDRLLILGDTNSGLAAIVAKRLGMPVYHMEAGNRCYDDRVPEEINRRIIDHSSDVLMPYTHRGKENLIREGFDRKNIYVIGNPIYEVINYYSKFIEHSKILYRLRLKQKKYFLVTMHRAENVDTRNLLKNLTEGLRLIHEKYRLPVICSLHPRTRYNMKRYGFSIKDNRVRFLVPLSFFDFVTLEKNALCVLTDSGTVQEECSIFHIPNVTIREVTERPETIECGSNTLTGLVPASIAQSVRIVLACSNKWIPPQEYLEQNVSDKIIKIITGYNFSTTY